MSVEPNHDEVDALLDAIQFACDEWSASCTAMLAVADIPCL